MCRNILDADIVGMNDILILSYYTVDVDIDGNTFTKDYD